MYMILIYNYIVVFGISECYEIYFYMIIFMNFFNVNLKINVKNVV